MAWPTKYTEAEKAKVIEAALQSIATGQSLNAFCKANNYPYMTVSHWLSADDVVSSARENAVRLGTHYLAGECLDIADELSDAKRMPLDPALDGNGDNLNAKVQVAKLRIDTRMRLIGKWNRKDYGDKQEHEHTSPDGSMAHKPTIINLVAGKADDDSDD